MPAYVIRIVLFMVSVTFLSFVYEFNYSNKAIELTGVITSISSQSKGREITISFQYPGQQNGLLISIEAITAKTEIKPAVQPDSSQKSVYTTDGAQRL